MKKRSKHKKPIGRLILAFGLAGVLLGAGGYAFYKRNLAKGVTLSESIGQAKTWLIEHKNTIHAEIKKTKKSVLDNEVQPKPVKFEFYDSLASSQVEVDVAAGAPVIPIKTSIQRNAENAEKATDAARERAVVATHEALEKELYAHVQAAQDDKAS